MTPQHLLTPYPRPIQNRPPYKPPARPVRYPLPKGKPKPVTVCIAAICEDESDRQRIVLCADTRLDYYVATNDANVKIGRLAHGWASMLSGNDWTGAHEFHTFIKAEMLAAGAPGDRAALHKILTNAGKRFMKSPLFTKAQIDLLICGFIGDRAIIATVGVGENSAPVVQFHMAFKAIGTGMPIAETFLNIRGCSTLSSMQSAIYMVYEAKKYSENAPGVGPDTKLMVLAPVPVGARPDQVLISVIDPEKQQALEEKRKLYGIQVIGEIPDLVEEYRLSPATSPHPQPPTNAT